MDRLQQHQDILKQGCLSIDQLTSNIPDAKIERPLYEAKLQRDLPIAFATLSALSAALSAVSTSLP